MKKRFIFVMSIMMIFSLVLPVNAEGKEISVQLDGEVINFDVSPMMKDNRTLVPMRAVFEKMGADVRWDQKNNTVWIENDNTIIEVPVNKHTALIHRKSDMTGIPEEITLDVSAEIYNGRTFVPLRFIGETLDAKVDWNGTHQSVTIITKNNPSKPDITLDRPITFTAVEFTDIESDNELLTWYETNEEEENYSYKTINGITYLKISAGMKTTGGYSMKVDGVYDLGNGNVYVKTSVIAPGPDDMVTQAITYPKLLIKLNNNITIKELTGVAK